MGWRSGTRDCGEHVWGQDSGECESKDGGGGGVRMLCCYVRCRDGIDRRVVAVIGGLPCSDINLFLAGARLWP